MCMREYACERKRKKNRENVCVCVREIENVREKERVCYLHKRLPRQNSACE